MFRPLILACVILPMLVFGCLVWLDHRLEMEHVRSLLLSTTDTLAEHAQEVVETSDLVIARVQDHIAGQDWDTLASSREVHEFLLHLKDELPQVDSVFLVDPAGLNVASSRLYPFPPINVSEREYYVAARNGERALHVSAPFRGVIAGTYAFTASRPRLTDGKFDGVIGVTISPAYFDDFYRMALKMPFTSNVALARTDGALLLRYPERAVPQTVLTMASPLYRAMRGGAVAGIFHGNPADDGHARLVAFRRLPAQPLVVSYGIDRDIYMASWRLHALILACLAVLLSAGLITIERLVSVRTSREHAMLRSLVAETERRQQVEAAMTQMQKIEALGRLTGGVAHDFNNLLAAILGSLELAMKRSKEERVNRLLKTAFEAAQRGARLTAQMLAFSRKHEVAPAAIDPNALIRGMDDMLRRSIGPLIRVHYELAPECWPAMVDRVQLEVAVLNLALNARDAMPLGGDLVLRTEAVSNPRVNDLRDGDFVRITVSDSGMGMSDDVQAHVFEPFYTTKGPGKGTGLGLSMVYGYVTQSGGAITLESKPGEGTTVSLYLPRASALPVEQPAEAPRSQAAELPCRVLLVDDDASVRTSVTAMIEDLGHEVVALESGAKALEVLAADHAFDVIMLDFAMPIMDGGQLAGEILRSWPDAPIVFMTGYVEVDILQPWLDRGFRTIRKPFTSADLAIAMSHVAGNAAPENVVALRI